MFDKDSLLRFHLTLVQNSVDFHVFREMAEDGIEDELLRRLPCELSDALKVGFLLGREIDHHG
jgi:hypothetical protein